MPHPASGRNTKAGEAPPPAARSPRALLLYLCGAFGGLLSGYDMGVVAGAQLFITRDLGLSPWMQGAFVSSLMIGAVVGCAGAGSLTERLGRRPVLLATAVVFAVGALGMALAPGPWVLIVFRTIAGLAVGTASSVIPTYLSELAPTRIRGRVSALNQMMIAVGIFGAYLVDLALAEHAAWRWMLGVALLPALVLFAGMWFQPETPRWLATHGRTEEARRVLDRLHGPGEAAHELEEIDRAARRHTEGAAALWRERPVRRALFIGITMAVIQQVIGSNTIVFYAPSILKAAGFGDTAALLNSVGLGALSIVMVLVAARLVDRVGRKPLLLTGLVAMVASMAVLSVVFFLGALESTGGKIAAVSALALFKGAYSLSWAPLLWVMLPELFPLRVRGPGVSVCSGANWGANFLVSLLFPVLLAAGAGTVFALFAVLGVAAFGFTFRFLKETAGRSLERLEFEEDAPGADPAPLARAGEG
ncbi:sugar porter family MFS transporter [Streptomyces sp. ODS28]|uniref:sugar porter family MFS transporter n=1 Tax=Streptomyces sp. ODS28 TaxID=3136688 RepID=UPI0031ED4D5D